eukprot:7302873-Lingulodinium_polyedra.AAC.1
MVWRARQLAAGRPLPRCIATTCCPPLAARRSLGKAVRSADASLQPVILTTVFARQAGACRPAQLDAQTR